MYYPRDVKEEILKKLSGGNPPFNECSTWRIKSISECFSYFFVFLPLLFFKPSEIYLNIRFLFQSHFYFLFLFHLPFLEKCLCPKKIRVAYYHKTPYTLHKNDKGLNAGIFYNILQQMISDVCDCSVVRALNC